MARRLAKMALNEKKLMFIFVVLFCISFYCQTHATSTCHQLFFEKNKITTSSTENFFGSHLIVLSESEYRGRAQSGDLPHDAILVLENLPLDVDLPLVVAVITKNPAKALYSHPQRQASSLGIPLIHSREVYDWALKHKASSTSGYLLKITLNQASLEYARHETSARPLMKSVLPRNFDRTPQLIVTVDKAKNFSRELVGDKFSDLAFTKQIEKLRSPFFVAATSGYYERFLDTYGWEGRSLREWRDHTLKNIASLKGETALIQTRSLLTDLQLKIQKSQPLDLSSKKSVFHRLQKDLQMHFTKDTWLSLRSNSDIESSLDTAGLFQSTKIDLSSVLSIETGFKQVAASIYFSRSFFIRQRLGLREENISMPLLVHAYIDRVQAHGVARMHYKPGPDFPYFDFSVALGSSEKATNPSSKAHIIQFNSKSFTANEAPELVRVIDKHFRSLYSELTYDLNQLRFHRGEVDLEFVVLENSPHDSPLIRILQYSIPVNIEARSQVLKGEISLDQVHKRHRPQNLQTIEEFVRTYQFHRLHELSNPNLQKEFQTNFLRFAIVQKGQAPPQILIFPPGVYHDRVYSEAQQHQFKYLIDGYVFARPGGRLEFAPSHFSLADSQFKDEQKRIFHSALKQALKINPEMKEPHFPFLWIDLKSFTNEEIKNLKDFELAESSNQ